MVNQRKEKANRAKTGENNADSADEGATHQFECTDENCGHWISVGIPTKVTKDFRSMDFYCGFCAAEKFKNLETKITNIENKLNQTPSERIQEQPFT